jgi:hypothetical protein
MSRLLNGLSAANSLCLENLPEKFIADLLGIVERTFDVA